MIEPNSTSRTGRICTQYLSTPRTSLTDVGPTRLQARLVSSERRPPCLSRYGGCDDAMTQDVGVQDQINPSRGPLIKSSARASRIRDRRARAAVGALGCALAPRGCGARAGHARRDGPHRVAQDSVAVDCARFWSTSSSAELQGLDDFGTLIRRTDGVHTPIALFVFDGDPYDPDPAAGTADAREHLAMACYGRLRARLRRGAAARDRALPRLAADKGRLDASGPGCHSPRPRGSALAWCCSGGTKRTTGLAT